MVLISSEEHNTCEFAVSNSVKHNNSNIRSIFEYFTQKNLKIAAVKDAKCIPKQTKAKELPKELLSTARLTTHLLPTKVEITADSDSNQMKNSSECYNVAAAIINNCCDSNCSTSCEISFGCNKRKMKQKQKQLQLQPLPQLLQLYKSFKAAATTATNVESIFSPSFKFRHRRNKTSKNLTKPVHSSSILKVINSNYPEQHQSSVALTATTNSIPLRTAAAINSKVTKKKSATLKKRKSLPSSVAIRSLRFRPLSGLKLTSLFSLLTFVCLETVLLSTVSNCAKTFYMHWNTSNSIFRIDNTDHIIDVNKGNLAFEFDQVHIICPVYEPGTFENETEKYIIYNVSKVEYETCRITNADPRVIAICDKPQKLMFFTITFRPFTPQPGGLEFLPGNDYYFISTSSKDDLYRRIGGRCSTNNMKVVFKVCCAPEDKSNKTNIGGTSGGRNTGGGISGIATGGSTGVIDSINNVGANGSGDMNVASGTMNQQHTNSINRGIMPVGGGVISINNGVNGGMQLKPSSMGGAGGGTSGTSINTNIDQFNRIPMQTNNINGGIGNGISSIGSHGSNGILLTPSVSMIPGAGGIGMNGQYPGHQQSGIRINNVPSQQQPSHKNNNDDHFNKHPNEVVKNEELTYNSAAGSLHHRCRLENSLHLFRTTYADTILLSITNAFTSVYNMKNNVKYENNNFIVLDSLLLKFRLFFSFNINPIVIMSVLLVLFSKNIFRFQIRTKPEELFCNSKKTIRKVSLRKSKKSSYLPILSSNCNPSLIEKILKEKCTNINTTASISYALSKNVKSHKHSRLQDLKNTYRR